MAEKTAAAAGLSRWQFRTVLTVLLSGQLLSALDQTLVGTALPTMVGEFGQLDSFSLVVTSYLLATTASMALYGKLGDLYGPKRVYMVSIGVFTAGSLLVGLAQDMTQLVVFRAVQGLGAGGLVVIAFTIAATVVPPRQLGRVQGLVGAMYALASLLGPLAGGALTEYVSWRWCFLVNVPIGIAGVLALGLLLKLPAVRRQAMVDYAGAILLVLAVSTIVLITIWGGTRYAWGSAPILGLVAATAVFVVLLIVHERRVPEPIIPLSLFRKPEISLALVITFIIGVATIGAYFFVPIYLQVVRGNDPTTAGLNIVPLMVAVMIGSGASGWLIAVVLGRMKVIVLGGVGIMTVGLYLFSLLDTDTPAWQLWCYLAVMGIGMGMVISKLIVTVQNSVSGRDIGTITAQANFFRVIGSAIGTAAFGAVLAARLASASSSLDPSILATLPDGSGVVYQDPASIRALAGTAPAAYHEVVRMFADSMHTVFLVAVPLMVLAFVLCWFLPNTKLRDGDHGHGHGQAPAQEQDLTTNPV
ncbi:MAG TPA: MDR family MFS transporter [Actinophytocola sp.]|jgi:EmrB/QacA subfamily drug resistance transporter|uniref:MDR family MFS transporter n=1 Tax=Actinophytocola sp. TaxID=1872138 RepID=UPI002F933233